MGRAPTAGRHHPGERLRTSHADQRRANRQSRDTPRRPSRDRRLSSRCTGGSSAGEIDPDRWRAYRVVRSAYSQRQEGLHMLRVKINQNVAGTDICGRSRTSPAASRADTATRRRGRTSRSISSGPQTSSRRCGCSPSPGSLPWARGNAVRDVVTGPLAGVASCAPRAHRERRGEARTQRARVFGALIADNVVNGALQVDLDRSLDPPPRRRFMNLGISVLADCGASRDSRLSSPQRRRSTRRAFGSGGVFAAITPARSRARPPDHRKVNGSAVAGQCRQHLVEIGDEVLGVLDSDGQAYDAVGDARALASLGRH